MNQTTPERIIHAARRIFADKGFAAASVREITREAGANLGAITYHFGSKQGLYDAVLEDAFRPLLIGLHRSRIGAAGGDGPRKGVEAGAGGGSVGAETSGPAGARVAVGGGDALERVESIVQTLFEALTASPDLQLLILQQAVHRRVLPGPAKQALGAILGAIEAALREGQREGSIRDGDATLMALSVMAQPVYFGLVRKLVPERLRAAGGGRRESSEVAEHAVRFTRAALATGSEGSR